MFFFFLLKPCTLLCCVLSLSCITNPYYCNAFTESRIEAMNTSASDGLEGFKAHAVFQEINKKLQEVITWLTIGDNIVNERPVTICVILLYDPHDGAFESLSKLPFYSTKTISGLCWLNQTNSFLQTSVFLGTLCDLNHTGIISFSIPAVQWMGFVINENMVSGETWSSLISQATDQTRSLSLVRESLFCFCILVKGPIS